MKVMWSVAVFANACSVIYDLVENNYAFLGLSCLALLLSTGMCLWVVKPDATKNPN